MVDKKKVDLVTAVDWTSLLCLKLAQTNLTELLQLWFYFQFHFFHTDGEIMQTSVFYGMVKLMLAKQME